MIRRDQQLWLRLQQQNIISTDTPLSEDNSTPWYIKTMQGIAGWFAALFMLGFSAAIFDWIFSYDNEMFLIIIGLSCSVSAFLIFRYKQQVAFLEQFALATSLCGQFMVCWGLFDILSMKESSAFLSIALYQGALALLMPNFLHRVMSCWFAMIALFWSFNLNGIYGLDSAIASCLLTLIWTQDRLLYRYRSVLLPIGFGFALSLIQLSAHALFQDEFFRYYQQKSSGFIQQYSPYIGHLFIALSCLFLLKQILKEQHLSITSKQGILALSGLLILLISSFPVTGASSALLILIIGFFRQHITLVALGIASLLSFLSWYYYNLSETLLVKSIYLLSIAALLLITLWFISFITRDEKGNVRVQPTMDTRKWLSLGTALLVLVVINANIFQKESLISNGRSVLLELAPVDPRSLMQGDYMRLRYKIATEAFNRSIENDIQDGFILAEISPQNVAKYIAIYSGETLTKNQQLLKFRIRKSRLKFATNAFFFEEGTADKFQQAKYGEFKVDEDGNMLLVSMRDAEFNLLGINKP